MSDEPKPLTDEELAEQESCRCPPNDSHLIDPSVLRRLVAEVRRLRAALLSIADTHGAAREREMRAEMDSAPTEERVEYEVLLGLCGICDTSSRPCSTREEAEAALGIR